MAGFSGCLQPRRWCEWFWSPRCFCPPCTCVPICIGSFTRRPRCLGPPWVLAMFTHSAAEMFRSPCPENTGIQLCLSGLRLWWMMPYLWARMVLVKQRLASSSSTEVWEYGELWPVITVCLCSSYLLTLSSCSSISPSLGHSSCQERAPTRLSPWAAGESLLQCLENLFPLLPWSWCLQSYFLQGFSSFLSCRQYSVVS